MKASPHHPPAHPLLRRQAAGFAVILTLLALAFLWQILGLLALYSDTIRAESALRQVSAREGWLVSDILVTDSGASYLRLLHREHIRGEDPETCHVLLFEDFSLQPCT